MSWLLSKRAVSPLVSAYEKQKEFITNASHELENASSVDIASLLNSSIEGFVPLVEAQGKSFNVSAPESITSKVNYEEIKKLFSILIENSIKYSKDNNTISIELDALNSDIAHKGPKEDAPLTHFSFSISNYSENLKKGSYDILFDRFYRLDSSRNSETGGFGIGLSIAKAIVRKHGGEIKAFSHDGERMVFRLEI